MTVYEQSPSFSRIGAGIILGANVTKVLRRLDLEAGFRRPPASGPMPSSAAPGTRGETLYKLEFDAASESAVRRSFRQYPPRRSASAAGEGRRARHDPFGHKLAGIEETRHGVTLAFDNGVSAEADIVIGADGIRSKVREIILGSRTAAFHRAVGASRDVSGERHQGRADPRLHQMVGAGPAYPGLFHDQPARRGLCHGVAAGRALGQRRLAGAGYRDEFIADFDDAIPT